MDFPRASADDSLRWSTMVAPAPRSGPDMGVWYGPAGPRQVSGGGGLNARSTNPTPDDPLRLLFPAQSPQSGLRAREDRLPNLHHAGPSASQEKRFWAAIGRQLRTILQLGLPSPVAGVAKNRYYLSDQVTTDHATTGQVTRPTELTRQLVVLRQFWDSARVLFPFPSIWIVESSSAILLRRIPVSKDC